MLKNSNTLMPSTTCRSFESERRDEHGNEDAGMAAKKNKKNSPNPHSITRKIVKEGNDHENKSAKWRFQRPLMSLAITASNHFGSAPVTMYASSPLVSPQQIQELKNIWMKEPDFKRHHFSKDLFDDGGFEDVDKDSFPNEAIESGWAEVSRSTSWDVEMEDYLQQALVCENENMVRLSSSDDDADNKYNSRATNDSNSKMKGEVQKQNNQDIAPQPNVVIIGKGYWVTNHPGNKYYHSIIDREKPAFDKEPTTELKRAHAEIIVDEIKYNHNDPGRFLQKSKQTGSYKEVERKVAIKKVWQALRDRPTKLGRHRK